MVSVAVFPSPLEWCCLPSLFWVVVLSHHLLLGGAVWSPPPLGGVVVFLSFWWCCLLLLLRVVVRLSSSSVGWCCLASPFSECFLLLVPSFASFGWLRPSSLLLGGAAWPLGGVASLTLFSWVVLLGFLLFLGGVACFLLLVHGGAILRLLRVGLRPSSSVGWCCLVPSFGQWCFSNLLSNDGGDGGDGDQWATIGMVYDGYDGAVGVRWRPLEYDGVRWGTMGHDGGHWVRWGTMGHDGGRWTPMCADGATAASGADGGAMRATGAEGGDGADGGTTGGSRRGTTGLMGCRWGADGG